jgi:pimeloyl-ACP methyl ester carboxylesterase
LPFLIRYWDPELEPDTYSYVRAAVKAGYSILTYDRLGTGLSDKPDAYDIIQAPLQVEILKELTISARSGELASNSKKYFTGGVVPPTFTMFVHVGHSFGSALTNYLLVKYPELSDGAIQTGWLPNEHFGAFGLAAFGYHFAPENDPKRFGKLGSGFIITGTKNSFQQLFLARDLLDPKILDYGFSIRQPGTIGEGAPTGSIIGIPATNFTGPNQVRSSPTSLSHGSFECKDA